jgi:hypothetical protein
MTAVRELRRADLETLIEMTARRVPAPARLYLLGDASHLAAGSRQWAQRLDLAADPDIGNVDALRAGVARAARELGVGIRWEHPGDVIPLPEGAARRMRATTLDAASLEVCHFDPVSVVFRLVARGDEDDYRMALDYLAAGWVTMGELEAMLERTLTRFTRETIQQDPAEFRRKFRGLRQMWRSRAPHGSVRK